MRKPYASAVSESRDAHLVNILGALSLALADGIREATEAAAGLTGAAPAALVALEQFLSGRSTEQLAQATGLTHSGAVRLVDRLVGRGLARRGRGPDGRSASIVLTAKGRALSAEITRARAARVAAALEGIDPIDRRTLEVLTTALISTATTQRLAARQRGHPPAGWLCRLCEFSACGRPEGNCPAANIASL